MPIDNTKVIDIIGTDNESGIVILTISDNLEWDVDLYIHLTLLQDKLNCYLEFIENGQIYEDYPNSRNNKVEISLVTKYPPSKDAIAFLERAKEVTLSYNIDFNWKTLA